MLDLVKRRHFWPKLKADVTRVVESYQVCQSFKGRTQNAGLYTPLSIPERAWEDVSMNFIVGLPVTRKKFDAIFVAVDRFSKMAHFIPCKTTSSAPNVAELFFSEIVRLQELTQSFTTDHDTRSLSHFWQTLWARLGTRLDISSAYHPPTDGQTEVVNRSLGDLLRCLAGELPHTWDSMLPHAEFAYNASCNRSTDFSPFQIVYGFPVSLPLDCIDLPRVGPSFVDALNYIENIRSS